MRPDDERAGVWYGGMDQMEGRSHGYAAVQPSGAILTFAKPVRCCVVSERRTASIFA